MGFTPIDTVRVERDSAHLSIVLDNPNRSNALSPDMVEALIEVFSNTTDTRSCCIRGEGRNFCAGFDLSDIADLSDGDLLNRFLRIETLLQMIHHAPFPVMALCQGHVIGAGADLVAACWKRIAAPGTKFKMPGWNFELALGTRRLARLIGADHARDMLIDTRSVDALEALSNGLVTDVVAQEKWATHIAAFQTRSIALSDFANRAIFDLTLPDTRAQDIAAIVASAGRPGLKARIQAYSATVAAARQKRTK